MAIIRVVLDNRELWTRVTIFAFSDKAYIGLSIMPMHKQAAGFSLQASGFGGGAGMLDMPVAMSEMYVVDQLVLIAPYGLSLS